MKFKSLPALTVFMLVLISNNAYAQISPGKLAKAHAELEGMRNCTQCHTLGGGPDTKKCLACHQEIQQRLDQKKGYHFFAKAKQNKVCFECHSEHNGREFQLIFWRCGMKNFNHNLTGFQLQGKHASAVQCRDCHQAKHIVHDPRKLNAKANIHTTFLGLAQDCLSCHQDEHQGQLSKDCLNCHTYDGWKPVTKFDHNNARFRLTGKHIPVDCAKCHAIVPRKGAKKGEKFTLVKFVNLKFNNCSACHTD